MCPNLRRPLTDEDFEDDNEYADNADPGPSYLPRESDVPCEDLVSEEDEQTDGYCFDLPLNRHQSSKKEEFIIDPILNSCWLRIKTDRHIATAAIVVQQRAHTRMLPTRIFQCYCYFYFNLFIAS